MVACIYPKCEGCYSLRALREITNLCHLWRHDIKVHNCLSHREQARKKWMGLQKLIPASWIPLPWPHNDIHKVLQTHSLFPSLPKVISPQAEWCLWCHTKVMTQTPFYSSDRSRILGRKLIHHSRTHPSKAQRRNQHEPNPLGMLASWSIKRRLSTTERDFCGSLETPLDLPLHGCIL